MLVLILFTAFCLNFGLGFLCLDFFESKLQKIGLISLPKISRLPLKFIEIIFWPFGVAFYFLYLKK